MIFFFSYSLQGQKKSSRVRRLHLYLCPPSHVPNPPSLFILTHTWAFVCVIHSRETDDSNLANRDPPSNRQWTFYCSCCYCIILPADKTNVDNCVRNQNATSPNSIARLNGRQYGRWGGEVKFSAAPLFYPCSHFPGYAKQQVPCRINVRTPPSL